MKVEIDVGMKCEKCDSNLQAELWGNCIWVRPCDNCLDNKYEEGYDDAKH